MQHLIDKDALLAEIEKLYNGEIDTYTRDILGRLKSNIDTLEVKEVDLKKSISDCLSEGLPNDEELIDYIKETAEHFFELGMSVSNKAQKGE